MSGTERYCPITKEPCKENQCAWWGTWRTLEGQEGECCAIEEIALWLSELVYKLKGE